ncbi:MAG: tail fiber protein [Chitinophagaceae bacterium]
MPFVGEIRAFAGPFVPAGWLLCDGSLVSVTDYSDLFAMIGTTYGGNGNTQFALPDLSGGRIAVQNGQLPGGSNYSLGEAGGAEYVTLTLETMPAHQHDFVIDTVPGTSSNASNNFLSVIQDTGNPDSQVLAYLPYAPPPMCVVVQLKTCLSYAGGDQPHENRQPFMCMNYIIATVGDIPSSANTADQS